MYYNVYNFLKLNRITNYHKPLYYSPHAQILAPWILPIHLIAFCLLSAEVATGQVCKSTNTLPFALSNINFSLHVHAKLSSSASKYTLNHLKLFENPQKKSPSWESPTPTKYASSSITVITFGFSPLKLIKLSLLCVHLL